MADKPATLMRNEKWAKKLYEANPPTLEEAMQMIGIQMLSDMPRAEKLNKDSIDKLMGIINTQLGDRSQHWSMSPPKR